MSLSILERIKKGHPDKTWREYWDFRLERHSIISDEFFSGLPRVEQKKFCLVEKGDSSYLYKEEPIE